LLGQERLLAARELGEDVAGLLAGECLRSLVHLDCIVDSNQADLRLLDHMSCPT